MARITKKKISKKGKVPLLQLPTRSEQIGLPAPPCFMNYSAPPTTLANFKPVCSVATSTSDLKQALQVTQSTSMTGLAEKEKEEKEEEVDEQQVNQVTDEFLSSTTENLSLEGADFRFRRGQSSSYSEDNLPTSSTYFSLLRISAGRGLSIGRGTSSARGPGVGWQTGFQTTSNRYERNTRPGLCNVNVGRGRNPGWFMDEENERMYSFDHLPNLGRLNRLTLHPSTTTQSTEEIETPEPQPNALTTNPVIINGLSTSASDLD